LDLWPLYRVQSHRSNPPLQFWVPLALTFETRIDLLRVHFLQNKWWNPNNWAKDSRQPCKLRAKMFKTPTYAPSPHEFTK
jgi:hypothetical protein